MWNFNICAPFLDAEGKVQLARKLMAGELWILLAIYALFQIIYLFVRSVERQIPNAIIPQLTPTSVSAMQPPIGSIIAVPQPPVIINTVKQHYCCGRWVIDTSSSASIQCCLGTTAWRQQPVSSIILCGIHLLCALLLFFFWICGCRKIGKILMGIMLTINAILLIMACIGVGATGYDNNLLNCYMKT